ncbi:alpha/beta fold hydrolase [Kitasatospora sp. HPMI-4]|uniref:alpha/beta fold hydrolase n=1 Tax=Kitasatospora sp. HPMI-4 TaxID=3448443 RepID=UPI003F1AE2F2
MINRRAFSKALGIGAASASVGVLSASAADAPADGAAAHPPAAAKPATGLGPLRRVRTELLDIAYHEAGPAAGRPVLLYHGWPYSPYAYQQVVPELVRHGFHCYVPYLRGHGPTRFLHHDTVRSGQQAALGSDVIAFMDALGIRRAIFGGYDWGGRGLCVAAALWPERCAGLVSVNSYLIQNLSPSVIDVPDPPNTESAHWYYYFLLTERGAASLAKDTKEFARVVWRRNSPQWRFTEADLDRAAALFDNPDYVAVVLNCYRIRRLVAPGDPRYAGLEARLLKQPPITVPAVTLDGKADGSLPWTNGESSAAHFTGPRVHHVVPHAGHNLPQETPKAFAAAVVEVSGLRQTGVVAVGDRRLFQAQSPAGATNRR